jgi:hypothetical protein
MVSVFRRQKLGTKFTIVLMVLLILGIVVSGITLYQVLTRRAEQEVTERGEVLIGTMNAVRGYTSGQVNPLLAERLETEEAFISQSVPAFSAREVFEGLRASDADFEHFLYKEATLNPTNPRNQADDFETELVNRFREDSGLEEITGFRNIMGEEVFYIARPLAISSEACLRCHSDPELAPASLINTYGTDGGFGWQLNEIVAAQMIYVPSQEVFNTARASLTLVMLTFVVIFTIVIMAINYSLRRNVSSSLEVIAEVAETVTTGSITDAELNSGRLPRLAERGDELGQLSRIFQKMAHEVITREKKLREQVAQLKIEVDEAKKSAEVKQIVETEYFQDLKQRAAEMRKKSSGEQDTEEDKPE